jgi:hypothetical protein
VSCLIIAIVVGILIAIGAVALVENVWLVTPTARPLTRRSTSVAPADPGARA